MNTPPSPLLRRIVIGKDPRRTLRRALLLALVCFIVFRYVFLIVCVKGISMEPTFHDQSRHIANLLKYLRKDPKRGDIVVISMAGPRAMYMKRVLALPGENIKFSDGRLFIDNRFVNEPYLKTRGTWTMSEMTLRSNEYFVAGDNRSVDISHHALGAVYRSDIRGGILF